jgi:hypothetical protein
MFSDETEGQNPEVLCSCCECASVMNGRVGLIQLTRICQVNASIRYMENVMIYVYRRREVIDAAELPTIQVKPS